MPKPKHTNRPSPAWLKRALTLFVCFFLFALTLFSYTRVYTPTRVEAAASSTLNFQARLYGSSGNIVPDGNYHIEFKLYDSLNANTSSQGVCSGDSSTDDCLWRETRTTGNLVQVKGGYFSVNLGDVAAFPNINWDQDLYLTMNIGGTSGSPSWDGEMTPRIKLTSVPYAFQANTARQLQIQDSGFTGNLGFSSPLTADRNILLPDASGVVCLDSGNCAGAGNAVDSLNSLQGDINITGSSQLTVTVAGQDIQLSIANDSIGNAQLQYDTGQHLTVTSSPVFGGLTVNGTGLFTGAGTGLSVTNNATVGGVLTATGGIAIGPGEGINFNNSFKTYEKTYNVNTATPASLADGAGVGFSVDKSYRVRAVITSTGTPTGATAIFYGNGTYFTLHKTYEAGTSSNHIEFFLDDGVPSVRLYGHASFYNVSVLTEETTNKGRNFGPEINLYGDLAGRIGIGTSSPSQLLHVSGGAGIVGRFSGRVIGGDAVNSNEFVTKGQLDGATGGSTKVSSLNSLTGDLNILGNAQISVSTATPNISISIANDSIGNAQLQYDTGQHLTVTSSPTFATIDTGNGAQELYSTDVYAQAQSATPLTSSDNLNSISDGWYSWTSNIPVNAPNSYMVMVQQDDGSQSVQMAFGSSGSGDVYVRRADNGNFYSWTRMWNSANDGSGSGLDADLLDGNSSAFFQNANNINTGTLNNARLNTNVSLLGQTIGLSELEADSVDSSKIVNGSITAADLAANSVDSSELVNGGVDESHLNITNTASAGQILQYGGANNFTWVDPSSFDTDTTYLAGNQLSLDGNTFNVLEGAGSGLDADLLDGQQGSYYLNASNINTGTLSDARLSTNVAKYDDGTANFTGVLQQDGNDVCTTAGNCSGAGNAVDSLNSLQGNITLQGAANEIEITDNGTSTITIGLPDDVIIGDTLTVTNGVTVGGTLTVAGVATFNNSSVFNGVMQGSNSGGLHSYRNLASFDTGDSAATGAIVIHTTIPATTTGTWLSNVRINMYEYSDPNQAQINLSFYKYYNGGTSTPSFPQNGYSRTGTIDPTVRLGINPSGNAVIIIGDEGSVRNRPKVDVEYASSNVNNRSLFEGWTTTLETDLSLYTNITTATEENNTKGLVTSVNGISQAVTIQGNSQVDVTPSGNNINLSIANNSIGNAQLQFDTGQHLTTSSSPEFGGLTLTGALQQSNSGITIATKDDISTRTNSGFYQTSSASVAEGWPENSGWYHLLSTTHSNGSNYNSMQFAGDFNSSNNLFYRQTDNDGSAAWHRIWHSGNDGSGSGLDADLLDGATSSYFLNASNINTGTLADARLSANVSLLGQTIESAEITNGTIQGIDIANDTITDTQLQYNTGQHLTTTSSPTFGGLTVNGDVNLGATSVLRFGGTAGYAYGSHARNTIDQNTLPTSFEDYSTSLAFIEGSASGFGSYGTYETTKLYTNNAAIQYFYQYNGVNADTPIRYRNASYDESGWNDWRSIASQEWALANFAPSSGSGSYVQLQSNTPGTAQTGNINISGTIIAGLFSGNGSGLTNLNASNISTGTLNDARLSTNVSLLGQTISLSELESNSVDSSKVVDNSLTAADLAPNSVNSSELAGGSVDENHINATNTPSTGQVLQFGGANNFTWIDPSIIDTNTTYSAGDGLQLAGTTFSVDNTVCRTSGNCSGVGGNGDILQGGNSFGANMIIGTNDNHSLVLETNGTAALTISSVGTAVFSDTVTAVAFSGSGADLTDLNASNINTGTLNNARLNTNVSLLGQTIGLSELEADSVDSSKIVNGSITAADLAANSVDSSELVNGGVDESHLNINNTATAGYILQYGGSNNFAWVDPATLPGGSSLWTQSGSNIYYDTGRVGIGMTTTPTEALHINGNIRLDVGHIVGGNTNGALVLNAGPDSAGSAAGIHFRADDVVGDPGAFTNLGFWDSNGMLGIGNTSPEVKLHITGGSDVDLGAGRGFLQLGDTSGTNMVIDQNEIEARNNGSGSQLNLNIAGNGLVNVGGDLIVRGDDIQFGGGEAISAGANLMFTSDSGFFDFRPSDATHGLIIRDFTGNSTAWGGIRAGTDGSLQFRADGASYNQLILGDNGNISTSDSLLVGGTYRFASNSTGDKINLYSNTYGIGIESNTLTNWSANQFRWRVGGGSVSAGAEVFRVDSNVFSINTSRVILNKQLPYNNTYGSLRVAGSGDVYQAHTGSSLTYKENVTGINIAQSPFAALSAIEFDYREDHPYRDRYVDFESMLARRHLGLSYENVMQVAPHWAYETNGMKAISFESMLPDLVGDYVAVRKHTLSSLNSLNNQTQDLYNEVANIQSLLAQPTFSNLTVTSAASIKTLNVTTAATIKKLTVTGEAIFKDKLTIEGHLVTKGAVPQITAFSTAIADELSAITVTGTDTAGTISFTTNSDAEVSLLVDEIAKLTFAKAYASSPKAVLSGNNAKSAKLGAYVVKTPTGFGVVSDEPLEPDTTYSFDYIVVGVE